MGATKEVNFLIEDIVTIESCAMKAARSLSSEGSLAHQVINTPCCPILKSSGARLVSRCRGKYNSHIVSQSLTPMEISIRNGALLSRQWEESGGAQAHFDTYVHDFPNMAITYVQSVCCLLRVKATSSLEYFRNKHLSRKSFRPLCL